MPPLRLRDVQGVTPEVEERLEGVGITLPFLLAIAHVKDLVDLGIQADEASKIIEDARAKSRVKFYTVKAFIDRIFEIHHISTGSKALDDSLDGGVKTMGITECFGPSAAGKTQLCLQLAVNVQLPQEEGGLDSKAVYIDTERGFTPKRVMELAEGRGIDPREALKNIYYARASTPLDLFERVKGAEEYLSTGEAKLLIIDNIIAPFTFEYDRYSLRDRQIMIQRLLWRLLTYTDKYNLAVFYTDRVYSIPDLLTHEGIQSFGGLAAQRFLRDRIFLSKYEGEIHRAKVYGEGGREVFFKVEKEGIKDL